MVVLTKQMSGLKLIMMLTILKTNSTANVLEINLLTTILGLNVTNVGITNQFKHSRMSTVWMRMVSPYETLHPQYQDLLMPLYIEIIDQGGRSK